MSFIKMRPSKNECGILLHIFQQFTTCLKKIYQFLHFEHVNICGMISMHYGLSKSHHLAKWFAILPFVKSVTSTNKFATCLTAPILHIC